MNLDNLFNIFNTIIVLDTETSGFNYKKDQIIELAAVRLNRVNNKINIAGRMDEFINLPERKTLSKQITQLTTITDELLKAQGRDNAEVMKQFYNFVYPEDSNNTKQSTLIVAYNAQFDLSFIIYQLEKNGLKLEANYLDPLTIYRDRRPYPHTLESAISRYGLSNKVKNTHRAIDDTFALLEVTLAMEAETDNLQKYINIFGFNPKYPIVGKRIKGVTYRPQGYNVFDPWSFASVL